MFATFRVVGGLIARTWDSSVNPATLTGALDVVAVEHDDGSITCTPFHVRFGRSSVYHADGQPVEMRVNGRPVALTIRLSKDGEANFIRRVYGPAAEPGLTSLPLADDGGTTDDDSASVVSADAAGSVMTAPPVPDEPSEAMLTSPTDPHAGAAGDRRVPDLTASMEREGAASGSGGGGGEAADLDDSFASDSAAQASAANAAAAGVDEDAERWPAERAGAAVAAAGGAGKLSTEDRAALTDAVQRLSVLDVDATRRQGFQGGASPRGAAQASASAPEGTALLDVGRLRLLRRLARHRRLAGMSLGQSGAVSDDDTLPRARRLRLLGARRRRRKRDRAEARRGGGRILGPHERLPGADEDGEDDEDDEGAGAGSDEDGTTGLGGRRSSVAAEPRSAAKGRARRRSLRAGRRAAALPPLALQAGEAGDEYADEGAVDVAGVVDAVMADLGADHGARRVGSFHVSPSGGRRGAAPPRRRRPWDDVPVREGAEPGGVPRVLAASPAEADGVSRDIGPEATVEPSGVPELQGARDGDAASLFAFLAAQGGSSSSGGGDSSGGGGGDSGIETGAESTPVDGRHSARRRPGLLRGATPVDGAVARPTVPAVASAEQRRSASFATLATRTNSSSSFGAAAHHGSASRLFGSAHGSHGALLGLDILDLTDGGGRARGPGRGPRYPLLVPPPAAPLDRGRSVLLLQLAAAPRADDHHRLRIRPVRLLASFSGPSALARAWPALAPAALASPAEHGVRTVVDRAWPTLCGHDFPAAHRHVIRGQSLSAEHLADPRLRFLVALRLDRRPGRGGEPACSVAVGLLTGWVSAAPYLLHAEMAARAAAATTTAPAAPHQVGAAAPVGPSEGYFSPTLAASRSASPGAQGVGHASPPLRPLPPSASSSAASSRGSVHRSDVFSPADPPMSYAQAASASASASPSAPAAPPNGPPPSPSLFGSILGVFASPATSTSAGPPVSAAGAADGARALSRAAVTTDASPAAAPAPAPAVPPPSPLGGHEPGPMPPLSLAHEPSSPSASVGAASAASSAPPPRPGDGRPDPGGRAEPREEARLRPSPDELELMGLRQGSNKLEFVVPSTGATAECTLFLWRPGDKVVISDVDGTITKSDAMGHIMYWVGADWTQIGVASLFQNIHRNGYKIVYLTSRAIGQVGSTKQYLTGISQPGRAVAAAESSGPAGTASKLPPGPVITSPDRLVDAFTREVILRRPEEFKKRALGDIASLFPEGVTPFYAGFGNRSTDQVSYEAVGVPKERIFIINPSGDISKDGRVLFRTYREMNGIVDSVFPAIGRAPSASDAASAHGSSPALSASAAPASPGVAALAEPGPASVSGSTASSALSSPAMGPAPHARPRAIGDVSQPSTRRLGRPGFTDPAFSDAAWWPSDSRRRVIVDTTPTAGAKGKPPRK